MFLLFSRQNMNQNAKINYFQISFLWKRQYLCFHCWDYLKNFWQSIIDVVERLLEVNLCQKLLFLQQLTHNMTTDCSIHENSKLKPEENMLCTEIVSDIQNIFCTQHVLPMFCKKKSFLQRFTCTLLIPICVLTLVLVTLGWGLGTQNSGTQG